METVMNLNFCRLCLNLVTVEIDLRSLFESDSLEKEHENTKNFYGHIKTYLDCYCFVGQVHAELNENTSSKLCEQCGTELVNAFNFLRKVQYSENILHKVLLDKENAAPVDDPIRVPEEESINCIAAKEMEIEVNENSVSADTKSKISNKNKHKTRLNKEISAVSFECEICFEKFTTKAKLNTHSRKHEAESTKCEICDKKFGSKYYMRLHLRTHEEERQTFDCGECDRKYYHENSLMMHKRIHTGNLLECDECHKKFVCKRELCVHKNSHSRIYQYVCDICGARYLRRNHLNTHMLAHEGLKAQCIECGKLFSSKRGLMEHSFVHTGQMPFPCNFCERGYPSKQKCVCKSSYLKAS